MAWEDFPDWFRHRWWRTPFFPAGFFEDMDQMIEEMFREMQKSLPKDLVREEKLLDGSTVRKIGPLVYGYSMSLGPDGKPVIREFGNVKPSARKTIFGAPRAEFEVKGEREPLIDTLEEDDTIKVVAELPGVEKEDITLEATENSLTISVDTPARKYYKEVELPSPVDPESVKASYRNGVLDTTLTKKHVKFRGKKIKIE